MKQLLHYNNIWSFLLLATNQFDYWVKYGVSNEAELKKPIPSGDQP